MEIFHSSQLADILFLIFFIKSSSSLVEVNGLRKNEEMFEMWIFFIISPGVCELMGEILNKIGLGDGSSILETSYPFSKTTFLCINET